MTQTNDFNEFTALTTDLTDLNLDKSDLSPLEEVSIGGTPLPGLRSSSGYRLETLLLLLIDAVALLLSICVGLLALRWFWPERTAGPHFPRILIFIPAFLSGLALHGVYWHHRQRLRRSTIEQVKRIGLALGTGVLLALASDAAIGSTGRTLKLSEAVAFALPAIFLVPLGRALYFHALPVRSPARVLIVGNGPGTATLEARLRRVSEISLVGVVEDDVGPAEGVIGNLSALRELVGVHAVEWVVVGFPSCGWQRTVDYLRQLPPTVKVAVVPRYYQLISWRSGVEDLHGLPVLHIARPQLSLWARFAKRAFDLVVATLATALLSPLFLLTAIAIKWDSAGPVFFRQARAGRNGETFMIFKFRTMCNDAERLRSELDQHNEVDGPIFKIRADPRITKVGALLRRTSLDELPQLLNVILGKMSLVGPRPFPVDEARRIEGTGMIRQNVLPGMTGLWQVSGRSDLTFEDLQHLDALYVSSWSFSWDLRIIMQTPSIVAGRRGAF